MMEAMARRRHPHRDRPFRRAVHESFSLAMLRRMAYALVSLGTGIVSFTLVVVGMSVAGGTMVTLVGFPLLWLTYLVIDGLVVVDRQILLWGSGRHILLAPHRAATGGWFRRLWARTVDPVTWRRAVYLLAQLPAGSLMFTVAVAGWSVPVALLLAPFADEVDGSQPDWLDGFVGEPITLIAYLPIALVAATIGAWAIRAVVEANAGLARALLGPTSSDRRRALEAQIAEQTTRREQAVASGMSDRQRIERDLHDGAQARLVALAMELGRTRERLDDEVAAADPTVARQAIERAHEQAKQALAEVRDLARGIHPAILTDRGLDAAVSSLVAASPVPVEVSVSLPDRLPPTVESAAYYVIAESLTNIARHSHATSASLQITGDSTALTVEIHDDGRGGADAASGTGLAGLAARTAAVGGVFQCTSPAGGPTVVRMMVPLASPGIAQQ